jgi:hypothetical protein
VSLFNGKDLAGWKTDFRQPGNWRVENGILIGSGPTYSYLYSKRGDYSDFHLTVEARVSDGGNSGVFCRSHSGPVPPVGSPSGYEAEICATGAGAKTGSLLGKGGEAIVFYRESPIPPGQWFVLEISLRGNKVAIKVDGKTTATFTDVNQMFTRGHITLQQAPRTTVEFRKIEIKELPPTEPAAQPTPDAGAARLIPPAAQRTALMGDAVWKVENDTLVRTLHRKWGGDIVFGDPSWRDYTFSFEVMKLDGDGPHGIFAFIRATDLHTHYQFCYGGYAKGTGSDLARMLHGQWSRGHNQAEGNKLYRWIPPMEKGRWYSFAFAAVGEVITCHVDGIKKFTWKDDSLTRGKVGLAGCPGSRFVFRKLKVTAPDGTVLWEGLPVLPDQPQSLERGRDSLSWPSNRSFLLGLAFSPDGRMASPRAKAKMARLERCFQS